MAELAYVFWHVPRSDVDEQAYFAALERFHRALAEATIPGFHGSTTVRITEPPWLPRPRVYEDWYVLDGFAALEALNTAAVSGPCQVVHDEVAKAAGEGTGGLYALRWGMLTVPSARSSHWFAKPAGRAYDEFEETVVATLDPPNGCLWQRQLVLGPAPEFCLMLDDDAPAFSTEDMVSFPL